MKINGYVNYYDLGYRLRREYWGKGIGFESALPFIDYGFNVLKVKEICGAADIRNIASNKILQKCGLTFQNSFDWDGDECNWYKIENSTRNSL